MNKEEKVIKEDILKKKTNTKKKVVVENKEQTPKKKIISNKTNTSKVEKKRTTKNQSKQKTNENEVLDIKPKKKSNASNKKVIANKRELNEKEVLEIKPKKKVNNSKKKELKIDEIIDVNSKNNTLINNDKVIENILDENNNNKEKDVPKKKRKLKKKFKILLIIFLLVIISLIVYFGITTYLTYQEKLEQDRIKNEQDSLTATIESHYGNYVKVVNDTVLFRKDENNNYYEYGTLYKDTELTLDEIEIDYLTEYFYSTDLDGYIKYNDLKPIVELTKYDNRYKNYIVFNQNVVTNNEFSLYDNDKKIYSFKECMSFPIIVKNDNGKYYVEFNNRLLYLLKDDIKEIVKANNTKTSNASRVTTLCYHRIYDKNEKCNDLYICKSKSNFEREMKYLSDNKFFTLTMEEMYLYLTKKIQVPKKSVVLTFDDGYLFETGIKILEKYNLHGTGFVKTGAFDDFTIFDSPNFELQSHTDKMHVAGKCPKETSYQQGGGILCLKESTVMNDLKTSRDKLNGAIALAYPFYDYNERAIKLVEKAGFKLAFIGANGVSGRATPGINTYKVPRMTIWNTTSFESFKSYVNN